MTSVWPVSDRQTGLRLFGHSLNSLANYSLKILSTIGAVIAAGVQAAFLENASVNRMDTDHCGRAFH